MSGAQTRAPKRQWPLETGLEHTQKPRPWLTHLLFLYDVISPLFRLVVMEIETVSDPSAAKSAINAKDQQKSNDLAANENRTMRNVMTPLALFGGTANGGSGKCACISRLLQQIAVLLKHRPTAKEVGPLGCATGSSEHRWSSLFRDFVLDPANCSWEKCVAHSDDMLWYVPIVRMANGGACAVGSETSHLQVFRRQSRNKPTPGDQNVNWQETVCLNLILQQLDYFVTVAVCTKNSPTNLQIHRKTCQRVYPSPSRRRMDAKGECEEVTYPRIYFAIDSFDEVFTDMVVSDGECICVELVVRDRYRETEAVIFLGSIRFDVLKHLYDSRSQQNSGAWNWAQRFISSSMTPKRLEFVKMRGPKGKGFAEMAVTRVAGCGFETPMSENGFEMNVGGRFDFNLSRRVSDVGATSLGGSRLFSRLLNNGGRRHARNAATPGGPPPSVTPTAFYGGQRTALRWFSGESTDGSEMGEGASATDAQSLAGGLRTPGSWSMRGIGKALQLLRDRKEGEDGGEQLNALLTYITLPWTSILEDLLAPNTRKPILTFELQLIQNR